MMQSLQSLTPTMKNSGAGIPSELFCPHPLLGVGFPGMGVTLGEVGIFWKGSPHSGLRAEDCQPVKCPAAGGVSPSSLKGDLDSASQYLQRCLSRCSLSAAAMEEVFPFFLSPRGAEDPSQSSPPLKLPSPNLQSLEFPSTKKESENYP